MNFFKEAILSVNPEGQRPQNPGGGFMDVLGAIGKGKQAEQEAAARYIQQRPSARPSRGSSTVFDVADLTRRAIGYNEPRLPRQPANTQPENNTSPQPEQSPYDTINLGDVLKVWLIGGALTSVTSKEGALTWRDGDPVYSTVQDGVLQAGSKLVKRFERATKIDLKVDDFAISRPATILETSQEIVKTLDNVVPAELGANTPGELDERINEETITMNARLWQPKIGRPEPTNSEKQLAETLVSLPPTSWIDWLKDIVYEHANNVATSRMQGGRLVSHMDEMIANYKDAINEWPLPKRWLVGEPYALSTIRNEEERKAISRTLWGQSFADLVILPITPGITGSDLNTIPWDHLFTPGQKWGNDPNAYLMRPATPIADYVRSKLPILSPALINNSPSWMAGTIVVENAQTHNIAGVIATLQPNEVIEMLGAIAERHRGVTQLVETAQQALSQTHAASWNTGMPRPHKVIEHAIQTHTIHPRSRYELERQLALQTRSSMSDLRFFESLREPREIASENREAMMMDSQTAHLDRIGGRLGEIFVTLEKEGYIAARDGRWEKVPGKVVPPSLVREAESLATAKKTCRQTTRAYEACPHG